MEATDAKVALIDKAFGQSNLTDENTSVIDTSIITEKLPVGILVCSLNNANAIEAHYLNSFAAEIFELPDNKKQFPLSIQTLWPHEDNYVLCNQIHDTFETGKHGSFE